MAFRSRHVQAEGKDTESLGGQCVRRLIELKRRVEADESRGEPNHVIGSILLFTPNWMGSHWKVGIRGVA